MKQSDLARLLGVAPSTVSGWQGNLPSWAEKYLAALDEIERLKKDNETLKNAIKILSR